MPEMRITSKDLETLGATLESLGDKLSERDRELLAVTFALAGKQVADNSSKDDDEVSGFAMRGEGMMAPMKGSLQPGLRDNFLMSMPTAPSANLGGDVGFDFSIKFN